jgi:hypothetical protein
VTSLWKWVRIPPGHWIDWKEEPISILLYSLDLTSLPRPFPVRPYQEWSFVLSIPEMDAFKEWINKLLEEIMVSYKMCAKKRSIALTCVEWQMECILNFLRYTLPKSSSFLQSDFQFIFVSCFIINVLKLLKRLVMRHKCQHTVLIHLFLDHKVYCLLR